MTRAQRDRAALAEKALRLFEWLDSIDRVEKSTSMEIEVAVSTRGPRATIYMESLWSVPARPGSHPDDIRIGRRRYHAGARTIIEALRKLHVPRVGRRL